MNNTRTVLIIEDSKTQADQVAYHLSKHDLDVIIAADGLQGLRLVNAYQPDLIVLDVNMPKLNGYQVCRRLKRDPETMGIPVIMLTSATEFDETQTGYQVGADEYIAKDMFAMERLLTTIEAMGFLQTEAVL